MQPVPKNQKQNETNKPNDIVYQWYKSQGKTILSSFKQ